MREADHKKDPTGRFNQIIFANTVISTFNVPFFAASFSGNTIV